MKKYVSLLVAFLMVISLCCSSILAADEVTDMSITADSEVKIYSSATMDDDFLDDRVMVGALAVED